MSELDDRYDTTYGTPGATGRPLPGQPLADQPTELVPPVGPEWRQDTVAVAPVAPADAPPGDPLDDIAEWEDDDPTRPDYQDPGHRDLPVLVRRPDTLAGLLLVFAGIAAGVSLLVAWVHGGATGLELVSGAVRSAGDPARLGDGWPPLAVVGGGVLLFLLGLLAFVPARTHRLLGALALVVALVVAAGVLVPLADAGWDLRRWAVGAWFTVAAGGLGFLGALKALVTSERTRR